MEQCECDHPIHEQQRIHTPMGCIENARMYDSDTGSGLCPECAMIHPNVEPMDEEYQDNKAIKLVEKHIPTFRGKRNTQVLNRSMRRHIRSG